MRDIYQEITDRIVAQMESGDSNWINPMAGSGLGGGWPMNATTGNRYNGINVMLLMGLTVFNGKEHVPAASQQWATFKQWQSKGCRVVSGKGSGNMIVFFKKLTVKDRKDPTGEATTTIPMLKTSVVFSAEQVEGEFADQFKVEREPLTEVEQIAAVNDWVTNYVNGTDLTINYNEMGRAFYRPSTDSIHMPPADGFEATATSTATECFHSTQLHELTHATGNKARLNRLDIKNNDGYAFEELVAELGAAFQCLMLGVSAEPREDHAKYLNNWIAALKNDKRLIYRAAKLAQQAVDHIAEHQPSAEQSTEEAA